MAAVESFTQGSVGKLLYRLALPGVWGLLANLSFNIADTYFVGQLSTDALAAMSFTFPVILVVTMVAVSFATGASSVYARLLGQKMRDQAGVLASDILLLSLIASLLIMVCGWWLMDPIFIWLGATPDLLPMVDAYMWVWYLNAPFFAVSAMVAALMQASGHTKVAGMLLVVVALLNVVLDPLLIFGIGPFPRLEIAGAAWTTVLTRVLLVAVQLYLVIFRYRLLRLPHWPGADMLRAWRAAMHVGLPAMVTGLIVPVAGAVTLVLVASHGPEAVAALGVAQRVEPVLLIGFFALSGVIAPFFGQNMSAELRHRQGDALRAVTRFSVLFTGVVAVVLYLFGSWIGRAFTDDERVIELVSLFFSIVPLGYGLGGLSMCVSSCFNGLGKPMPASLISAIRMMVLYLPFVWLGQMWWGLTGLFVGILLANVLAGLFSYVWLRRWLVDSSAQPA